MEGGLKLWTSCSTFGRQKSRRTFRTPAVHDLIVPGRDAFENALAALPSLTCEVAWALEAYN